MKILHTADWHMNDTLGRVDRTEDIFRALEQIAAYLEEHQVDVMIVAGDLFSERSRPDQTRGAITKVRDLFRPFLARGGTILAISGNHDSEIFFETLRDAFDLIMPAPADGDGANNVGRLWLLPRPRKITIADKAGTRVQFVMMPYPTARCYLRGDGTTYSTIEEKHRAVQSEFTRLLDKFKTEIDPTLPAVLVSHIHVRGAQTHNLYKVTEIEDVIFEKGDIPTGWAYVAYGHIHKPQALPGGEHIRYCGSVERLDYAERDDEKSVVLFEVGPEGRRGEPQLLPLQSTPILHFDIRDPQTELPQLKAQFLDNAASTLEVKPLVNYTLHWEPGKDNRDAICRELNTIFPRWYAREFVELGRGDYGALQNDGVDLRNVTETVRTYLQTQLATTPGRDEVLELAEALLAERDLQGSTRMMGRAEANGKAAKTRERSAA